MPLYILNTKLPHSFPLNGFSCLTSGTEEPYNAQHEESFIQVGAKYLLFSFVFSQMDKNRELLGSNEIYFCLPISKPTVFHFCSGRLKVSHSTVADYHCVSS